MSLSVKNIGGQYLQNNLDKTDSSVFCQECLLMYSFRLKRIFQSMI
jgi:hypothetical protein